MNDRSARPSFPAVSGRLLGEAPSYAEIAAFLERAEAWRAAACQWLAALGPEAPISEKMRKVLRAALRDPEVPAGALAGARVYRVEPFPPLPRGLGQPPAGADYAGARRYLLDILVWRSRLVDFLSDVWDVMGPPLLEMEECEWAIRELLTASSKIQLCLDCLQPMPTPDFEQRHFADCVVRMARGDPELG
jgi:hypothetical protein